MNYNLIVIGGGPAGMMAAITAASRGKNVLLLERNESLGKKLLITGKGRCNVTNNSDVTNILNNIPENPKFMYSSLMRFDSKKVISFFEDNGVKLKTERGNRVFPISDRASDILECLVQLLNENNVTVKTEYVVELLEEDKTIKGVKCESDNTYSSSNVLIATGGKSYPRTGSTGDGYVMAQKLSHTVTKIKPSLVPIVSNDKSCKRMQGLSLKNVELKLLDKQKNEVLYKELGEMLFTHFGMSGPMILSASSHIRQFQENRYEISIDLKPGLTEKQLDARVLRDFSENINADFINSLSKLLPRKMIPTIVERCGIDGTKKVHEITKDERKNLVSVIKGLTFSVDGFRSIDEAIITSGGISVKEINPKNMESKIIKGLYFAGEVIDVDGYTGGYNLQIAFSTGYAVGASIE